MRLKTEEIIKSFMEKCETKNQSKVKEMTKVLCDFRKCIYNHNGVCTKEVIDLDERVEDIFIGCPDAEWEAETDNNSAYEALNIQAKRKELPYDAMGDYSKIPQYTTPDEWYRDNFIRREPNGLK